MSLVIDRGFRPVIYDYAHAEGKAVLDGWGVTTIGEPVHAIPPLRAAVWQGTRYNAQGETVAILASIHKGHRLPNIVRADYYFGIATREAVELLPPEQRPEALADAAIVPCTSVKEGRTPLRAMLDMLNIYAPPPTID